MEPITCCAFPTTSVFIDDSIEFLENLSSALPLSTSTHRMYNDPYQALKFINSQGNSPHFMERLVQAVDEEEWEHRRIDVSIADLHQTVYHADRFKQVSCAIIDYDMPGIKGLEVCQKITAPHIYKILLTGAADEHLAVEAFNKGLINAFIRKQSDNMVEHIAAAIQKGQHHFFLQLSSLMMQSVGTRDTPSALLDPIFPKVFQQIKSYYNAVEHYLFESTGAFVFLDAAGNNGGLFIYHPSQVAPIIEQAKLQDASKARIDALINYKKILCYHNSKNVLLPDCADWDPYLYDAQKLSGNNTYYYAHAPGSVDLNSKKIGSFFQFKNNHQAEWARAF